tara:strand:+ start:250 stop:597 length:348 start_codon:yes stop_codon:yes gene_type:complete
MESLVYSFLNASILFFLYKTDAFVEYVKLFRLEKVFEIDKYEKFLDTVGEGDYWTYLTFEKRNFIRKLISCPYCVSFWLNLATFSYHQNVVFLIINIWLTLFLFLTLNFLSSKAQ